MKAKRGVAIIVVLMTMAVLAVVALGLSTMGSGNVLLASSDTEISNVTYGAEGAAWLKIAQIVYGDDTDIAGTLPTSDVIYDVDVLQGGEDYDGWTVPGGPETYFVVASAWFENSASSNRHVRKVGILGRKSSSAWDNAAFGAHSVEIRNTAMTVAYNSSGPAPPNHSAATVGTNLAGLPSDATRGIHIDTNGRVGGPADPDADAKVLGPPNTPPGMVVKSGNAPGNYASFSNLAQTRPMDPVLIPDPGRVPPVPTPVPVTTGPDIPGTATIGPSAGLYPPGPYDDVTVGDGETLTIELAEYADTDTVVFVFNSLTINRGQIVVNNPNGATCEIFLQGAFTMDRAGVLNPDTDGIAGPAGKPGDLKFFSQGNVFLDDEGTEARYVIYAPQNEVTVKKADLYGSVVAYKVILRNDAQIHYDIDLANDTSGGTTFLVTSTRRF